MKASDARRIFERKKALHERQQEIVQTTRSKLRVLTRDLSRAEKALLIIQRVAIMTQEELRYSICELVTLALSSVYEEDALTMSLEFVTRRNRTEADIIFSNGEDRIDPMDESAGGVVDIASFALRVALWKLTNSRPVMLLDEPFRFLGKLQTKAGEIILELSKKLGLQIIMVSHDTSLISVADRTFSVTKKNKISKAEVVNVQQSDCD